jgi:hypothetical protein
MHAAVIRVYSAIDIGPPELVITAREAMISASSTAYSVVVDPCTLVTKAPARLI